MKLWHSFLKELKLSSKGFYFYIEILMAIIILVILLVFIPEEMSHVDDEYLNLDMPEAIEAFFVDKVLEDDLDGVIEIAEMELGDEIIEARLIETEDKAIYLIPNREDMIELTKADRPLVGAYVTYDEAINDVIYEYYLQGYESDRLQNLYLVIHTIDLDRLVELTDAQTVKSLSTAYEPLNSREMALPSLLTFNGSLMGMFIIAAYIFLDKQEGVIKAYAVTASKVWQYLMSKVLVMMVVTVITTLIIAIPVMGMGPNYFMMLVLLLTSAFFASALGLIISSFFTNMNQAFGAIYGVMMVLMMPAIAYFIPSWEPFWVKLIPTHYLIQGFKETIIVNGDMVFVWVSSLAFLGAGVILFILANQRFKKTLTV